MNLAPYPNYQRAPAEWIGQVPCGWQVRRIGQLFEQRNEKVSDKDYPPLSVTKKGVVPQMQHVAKTDDNDNRKLVLAGDFVINSRSDRKGSSGLSHLDGSVSLINTVLRPKGEIIPEFAHYLLRSYAFQEEFYRMGNGLVADLWTTNFGAMKVISIPLPPRDEQQQISNFLQTEMAHFDRLIGLKNEFIELLSERMVSSVVNTTRPRAQWSNRPFWTLVKPKSISGQIHEDLLSVYLDRGVIPYSEGGGLVHKPAESLEKYQLVEPGDLVMNNQQAWRGSLGVSNHRGIVSPAYLIFELDREQIDPAFANYAFRSRPYVDQFMLASMSVGDIQRQIKWPHLRRVMVSLPPLSEQKQIVEELDRSLFRLEGLIARTRMSVTYLQEKRTALITAAVTGKIDVRNAA